MARIPVVVVLSFFVVAFSIMLMAFKYFDSESLMLSAALSGASASSTTRVVIEC